MKAFLQYCNTPHQDCRRSPAQMVFGRTLRDQITSMPHKYAATANWCISQELRERKMAKSREVDGEKLATKQLGFLQIGTPVALQNQSGRYLTKWDKTGVVVEVRPLEQVVVKVDGSRRLTLRNRRFVIELDPRKTSLGDQPHNTEPPKVPVTRKKRNTRLRGAPSSLTSATTPEPWP